jgi:hypothetical protein
LALYDENAQGRLSRGCDHDVLSLECLVLTDWGRIRNLSDKGRMSNMNMKVCKTMPNFVGLLTLSNTKPQRTKDFRPNGRARRGRENAHFGPMQ